MKQKLDNVNLGEFLIFCFRSEEIVDMLQPKDQERQY